jgi:phosphatidylglycerophosphate synthase
MFGLKVASKKGEIYNEFFDRLSDIVIFAGLSLSFIINNVSNFNIIDFYQSLNKIITIQLPLIMGFIFIILVILNSYLGILSKSAGGERIYKGILGKADRMFYLSIACIVFFFYNKLIVWIIFFAFSIIAISISIGQRLWLSLISLKD